MKYLFVFFDNFLQKINFTSLKTRDFPNLYVLENSQLKSMYEQKVYLLLKQ